MPSDVRIAAAYIRVSTEDQTEYSPDAQLVEIRKYAAAHGYVLPQEFIFQDDGISGKRTEKRPEFNRMIGTAKQKPKPFDAILLWKFSRFARNREDSIVYKSMLRRQLGIDVISISEPLADDKMSIIMEAMIEAMDEYYSINLAEEVKRGMTEKARRGELQTSPSFGYRAENKMLVPIPEEAAIVRMIFEKFNNGDGILKIVRDLNALGVKTHRGSKFETGTVKYLLQNPVYIGKLRWNPSGKSRRNFSGDDVITTDANHEPLVSEDQWETAQKRFTASKEKYPYYQRSGEMKSWVSGLVRCGECGRSIISSPPGWWRCCGYAHGTCAFSQRTSDEAMRDVILSALKRDAEIGVSIEQVKVNRKAGSGPLSAFEAQKKQIEARMERLRDAYLAGVETLESYKVNKASLEAQADQVLKKIGEYTVPVDITAIIPEIKACYLALEDATLNNDQKNKAAHKIIEKCVYDRDSGSMSIFYSIVI